MKSCECSKTRARKWPGVLGMTLAAFGLSAVFALLAMQQSAIAPQPSPKLSARASAAGFPVVDWGYWHSVNSDIVGWVSIPGTSVSYPIVQAREDDPDYYLDHDVYGNWNIYGAVHLDAECSDGGLFGSCNAVVLGHHMNDGTMFTPIASYTDGKFRDKHRLVYVQSPQHQVVYSVISAQRVDAAQQAKQVCFSSRRHFADWLAGQLGPQLQPRAQTDAIDRVLELVTCSYVETADERAVARARPLEIDGVSVEQRPAAAVLGVPRYNAA